MYVIFRPENLIIWKILHRKNPRNVYKIDLNGKMTEFSEGASRSRWKFRLKMGYSKNEVFYLKKKAAIDPPGHSRIGGHYFHAWCPSVCPSVHLSAAKTKTPCDGHHVWKWWPPIGCGLVDHLEFARLVSFFFFHICWSEIRHAQMRCNTIGQDTLMQKLAWDEEEKSSFANKGCQTTKLKIIANFNYVR